MTGSKQESPDSKSDDMVRSQEEIMGQINQGRLDMKEGREQLQSDMSIKEQATKAMDQNKQK